MATLWGVAISPKKEVEISFCSVLRSGYGMGNGNCTTAKKCTKEETAGKDLVASCETYAGMQIYHLQFFRVGFSSNERFRGHTHGVPEGGAVPISTSLAVA